ncbi:MAG: helix-turn-helix domain-containing protein [Bacteroidota bacterium]
MTEKQKNILEAALKLFAVDGYNATSTSKVAKAAGVSEGLIFRHFKNKEGLLNAILEEAHQYAKLAYADIILTEAPRELIMKALSLPFTYGKEHYEHWRLVYALKWQTNRYDETPYAPIKKALTAAFSELGYADPVAEAELIFILMDGAATAMLLHEPKNKMEILAALQKKYEP